MRARSVPDAQSVVKHIEPSVDHDLVTTSVWCWSAEILVANCRSQLTSFLEDPEVPRLMIYMDGKDLAAVSDSYLAFWHKKAFLAIFTDR